MQIPQPLVEMLCHVIGHHRDKRKCWHDNDDWRSICTRCGVDMVRDSVAKRWHKR